MPKENLGPHLDAIPHNPDLGSPKRPNTAPQTRAAMVSTQHSDHSSTPPCSKPSQTTRDPCYPHLITLAASIRDPKKTSLHDITDVYSRLKTDFRGLDALSPDIAAERVTILKQTAPVILKALQRDIRALILPSPPSDVTLGLRRPAPQTYAGAEHHALAGACTQALGLAAIVFFSKRVQYLFDRKQDSLA